MSGPRVHVPSAGRHHLRPLAIAFVFVTSFMVVEAIAGFWTGSLALIADAGHMATDALGLGLAVAAIVAADRAKTNGSRTYGLYRLEILAALANSLLLLAVALYVLWDAFARFSNPSEVQTTPMLIVALGGLVVNLVAWKLLRDGAEKSLNVKGAYFEVVADLAGSVGVVLAALITIVTGWPYADPLFAALIGLFILPRAWALGGQALRILNQAAPPELDLEAVEADLLGIDGVIDVHDLHVWTLTSAMDVATAHLMTATGVDAHPILDQGRDLLESRHGIVHATLQVEPEDHEECSEVTW